MKKILFAIVAILSLGLTIYNILTEDVPSYTEENKNEIREIYNDETNMRLSRSIAAMTEAKSVAVIGNREGILIGISLKSGTSGRKALYEKAKNAAEKEYPKTKILIEIDTEKTDKILNLAINMGKGIPRDFLVARMSYLLEN